MTEDRIITIGMTLLSLAATALIVGPDWIATFIEHVNNPQGGKW